LIKVTEVLSDARQFEAFNRLSSYVVHDLKNLVAQLSLVVTNARKHMHNPEFMEDAIATIENATLKMNRLLESLRKGRLEETASRLVNLKPVLDKVVELRGANDPAPTLDCSDTGLIVAADAARVEAVLEHLVQNAQEATPADGRVTVRASRDDRWALVEVEDTGCGMDEEFVADRLFRPFDTTKGNAGMGIGVYESREFVRSRGGDMVVRSLLGQGTTFRIRFPLKEGEADPPVERTNVEATG
jgi:putative PEP-CTERM system histidine kinase